MISVRRHVDKNDPTKSTTIKTAFTDPKNSHKTKNIFYRAHQDKLMDDEYKAKLPKSVTTGYMKFKDEINQRARQTKINNMKARQKAENLYGHTTEYKNLKKIFKKK